MPPQQCPACGRFLRKDLIASLALGPQPCPRCEMPLSTTMFDDAAPAAVAEATAPVVTSPVMSETTPEPSTPEPSTPEPSTPEPEGVPVPEPFDVPASEPFEVPAPLDVPEPTEVPETTPPADDLPSTVLGTTHDPLVSWDPQGYEARTTDVLQAEDHTPMLTAGGAASGALVGFVALGRTRSRGALLGALVGAVTGVVVSRMTRPVD